MANFPTPRPNLSNQGIPVASLHDWEQGRRLPDAAALAWARLMADGTATGRPRSALDTMIAAIAETNGLVVATDNERDFVGVETINPMRA